MSVIVVSEVLTINGEAGHSSRDVDGSRGLKCLIVLDVIYKRFIAVSRTPPPILRFGVYHKYYDLECSL